MVFSLNMDLWFLLSEGKPRCFLEDVPKDTLIVGNYEIEAEGGKTKQTSFFVYLLSFPKLTGAEMYKGALYATIADPEGNIVYSRDIKLKGKFTYTSQVAGEHRICLQTNSSGGWFSSKQVVSSNC